MLILQFSAKALKIPLTGTMAIALLDAQGSHVSHAFQICLINMNNIIAPIDNFNPGSILKQLSMTALDLLKTFRPV